MLIGIVRHIKPNSWKILIHRVETVRLSNAPNKYLNFYIYPVVKYVNIIYQ